MRIIIRRMAKYQSAQKHYSMCLQLKTQVSILDRVLSQTDICDKAEPPWGENAEWSVIDVGSGSERIAINGPGLSGKDATWQRSNSVRRFGRWILDSDLPGSEPGLELDYENPRRPVLRSKFEKDEGMWTEITRDLVEEEVIQRLGYTYQVTDLYIYLDHYLRYVSISFLA